MDLVCNRVNGFILWCVRELDDSVDCRLYGVRKGCVENEVFAGPVKGDKVGWEWVGGAAGDDGAVSK